MKNNLMRWIVIFGVLILLGTALAAADTPKAETEPESPTIAVTENMGEAIVKEAEQVKEDIQQQVITLSRWTPLGWNLKTIDYITQWVLQLPLRVPELMQKLMTQGRVLGAAGSLVMLTFLAITVTSLRPRSVSR
jgi:hypothetical protein